MTIIHTIIAKLLNDLIPHIQPYYTHKDRITLNHFNHIDIKEDQLEIYLNTIPIPTIHVLKIADPNFIAIFSQIITKHFKPNYQCSPTK